MDETETSYKDSKKGRSSRRLRRVAVASEGPARISITGRSRNTCVVNPRLAVESKNFQCQMELVLLVFFSHPPACDEAARRFHFYGRLATTFALWRSRAISESKDHKKWVRIFLEMSKPNPDPDP